MVPARPSLWLQDERGIDPGLSEADSLFGALSLPMQYTQYIVLIWYSITAFCTGKPSCGISICFSVCVLNTSTIGQSFVRESQFM